jgi:mono/diheme cytochrome c family protein
MRGWRRWLLVEAVLLAGLVLAGLSGARAAQEPSVERGKAAFSHRCGMCHRDGGTGTFILKRRLGADKSLLEKRTDLNPVYVRTVVRWGLTNMPRISRVELPDPDLEAVIAYLNGPKAAAQP